MRHMKHISSIYAPHISPNSAYFPAYFASKSSAYFKKILRYKPASLTDDHADSTSSGKSAKASNLLLSAMAYVNAVVRSCLRLPESNWRVHFRRCLNWGWTAYFATVKKWSVLAEASALRKTWYDLMLRISFVMMWSISFFVRPSLEAHVYLWTLRRLNQDPETMRPCELQRDNRREELLFGLLAPNGPTRPSSSSSYGVFFQSVAVSTMWRQSARPEAFLHAEERPMFRGLRSASTERNQV